MLIYTTNFVTGKINTSVEDIYLPDIENIENFMPNIPDTVTVFVGKKLYRLSATATATPTPTVKPTAAPTATPTEKPAATPTKAPTASPTKATDISATPSANPAAETNSTVTPTAEPPTAEPTATPATIKTGKNDIVVNGLIYKINSKTRKTLTLKGCKKAKAKISIPATVKYNKVKYKVTKIAAKAFKNNKKLKQLTIGKNITSIGKEAFSGCSKLKTITIKSKVLKKVGKNAFKGINKKAIVTIPKLKQKKLFGKIKTVVKK